MYTHIPYSSEVNTHILKSTNFKIKLKKKIEHFCYKQIGSSVFQFGSVLSFFVGFWFTPRFISNRSALARGLAGLGGYGQWFSYSKDVTRWLSTGVGFQIPKRNGFCYHVGRYKTNRYPFHPNHRPAEENLPQGDQWISDLPQIKKCQPPSPQLQPVPPWA